MKFTRYACICFVFLCSIFPTQKIVAEDGYGSISGKFVFKGMIPARVVLHKKGANVKDAAVCAASTLYSDELVIDEKSKGVANIFVFLRNKPKQGIHPTLKAPPKKKVVFNQKGCRFEPHALLLRAGQTILVKTSDNCAHNTRINPIDNEAHNFTVPANYKKSIPLTFEAGEIMPISVVCDYHSWMKSYWLILDHPYAAISATDGSFKIDKLPAGEYEFFVWHEKVGWLGTDTKKGFKAKITSGKDLKLDPFELTSKTFAPKK